MLARVFVTEIKLINNFKLRSIRMLSLKISDVVAPANSFCRDSKWKLKKNRGIIRGIKSKKKNDEYLKITT